VTRWRRGRAAAERSAGPAPADRGSATVWVAIACLVTWAVAIFALSIGGVIAARHEAASAADLAALAGARTLAAGMSDPCAEAQRVAAGAKARVIACGVLTDGSLQVVVETALPRLLARWPQLPPAQARARAGISRSFGLDSARSWKVQMNVRMAKTRDIL
jgi:secretion/DNA translocation related TadE-like protein